MAPYRATTPALFDVEISDDRPLGVLARPGSADDLLELVVLDPDGYPVVSVPASAPGAPVTATVPSVRRGSYRVVVTSSRAHGEVTASLAPIPTMEVGQTLTTVGSTAVLVDSDGEQTQVITASAADGLVTVDVIPPQGSFDPLSTAAAPGPTVTALFGGAGPGIYEVRISALKPAAEVTTTLAAAEVQDLVPGSTAAVSPRAGVLVFDVEVATDQLLEFRAEPGSATGVEIVVVGPDREPSYGSVADLQLLPDALPEELAALLPEEVVDLFAGGLPETYDEAELMLFDAGLLDSFYSAVYRNPQIGATLFGTASDRAGEPAVTVVGGHGEGTYRVVVTSSGNREGDIDVTLAPIQVQPLAKGATVTATAPAVFEIAVARGRSCSRPTRTQPTSRSRSRSPIRPGRGGSASWLRRARRAARRRPSSATTDSARTASS